MSQSVPVTLEAVGVASYEELYALPTDEVIRRISAKGVPLHEGDAFLAVLAVRSVADLRETTQALDRARARFDRATLVLALLAVAVSVGQLVAALD